MEKRLAQEQFGLKVLAFVIACFLWLFVVNISDPVMTKTYHNITVEVTNQDVLSKTSKTYSVDSKYEKVDVVITAKRRIINQIKTSDIFAYADLAELGFEGDMDIPIIPIEVNVKNLDDEIENIKATPSNLQVSLEEEQTKTFPIIAVVNEEETVADNCVLGDMVVRPETITIRGAKSKISQVSYVQALVHIQDLASPTTVSSELILCDEDNNVIEKNHLDLGEYGRNGVSVDVEVLPTKKIPLTFNTNKIETADGYYISEIKAEPEMVLVTGTQEELDQIDHVFIPPDVLTTSGLSTKIEKTIDIEPILEKYDIKLADENANSVVVTVSVARKGTRSYDVSLGNIIVTNLKDGYIMEYENSQALEVKIQGSQTKLQELDLNESLSINLTNFTDEGVYDVPVQVKLPVNCSLAEPLTVKIKISKKGK